MTGAMCAKKRCNNATSIELPAAQNAELRQVKIKLFLNPKPLNTSLIFSSIINKQIFCCGILC